MNVANVAGLEVPYLSENRIGNVSALANTVDLSKVWPGGDEISDIYPPVRNDGLSTGDNVFLARNPLRPASINTWIPQLEATRVDVN